MYLVNLDAAPRPLEAPLALLVAGVGAALAGLGREGSRPWRAAVEAAEKASVCVLYARDTARGSGLLLRGFPEGEVKVRKVPSSSPIVRGSAGEHHM